MEVEVCCDIIGIWVVGRMLHWAELKNIVSSRHDHHAARMLARGALDAGTADRQALLLCAVQNHVVFFRIFLDEPNRGLIRNRRDGSGFKHVVLAEQRLCVPVCPRLVFAGEVQIDIRCLVAVEPQEGFKGDGVAVAVVIRAAFGAFLRRKVKAGTVTTIRDKFAVLAVRADVVRSEGVDL